jgi:hypothetical protein
MKGKRSLIFEKSPFLHEEYTIEDCLHGPYKTIEGFYIAVLMGGPILSTGTFADIYETALKEVIESESPEGIKTL